MHDFVELNITSRLQVQRSLGYAEELLTCDAAVVATVQPLIDVTLRRCLPLHFGGASCGMTVV